MSTGELHVPSISSASEHNDVYHAYRTCLEALLHISVNVLVVRYSAVTILDLQKLRETAGGE